MTQFDVFAVAPTGLEIHFQISGEKAYSEALALLAQMEKDGFKARTNGKGHSQDTPTEEAHFCTKHGVPFKQYSNEKGVWYSHKDGDKWCNEAKAKNGKAA